MSVTRPPALPALWPSPQALVVHADPDARPLPIVAAPGGDRPRARAAQRSGRRGRLHAAGRDRGLDVLGVVSTRDVTGADGAPERDVMLRVARDGTQLEVRCNYKPETGLARIMLI